MLEVCLLEHNKIHLLSSIFQFLFVNLALFYVAAPGFVVGTSSEIRDANPPKPPAHTQHTIIFFNMISR